MLPFLRKRKLRRELWLQRKAKLRWSVLASVVPGIDVGLKVVSSTKSFAFWTRALRVNVFRTSVFEELNCVGHHECTNALPPKSRMNLNDRDTGAWRRHVVHRERDYLTL